MSLKGAEVVTLEETWLADKVKSFEPWLAYVAKVHGPILRGWQDELVALRLGAITDGEGSGEAPAVSETLGFDETIEVVRLSRQGCVSTGFASGAEMRKSARNGRRWGSTRSCEGTGVQCQCVRTAASRPPQLAEGVSRSWINMRVRPLGPSALHHKFCGLFPERIRSFEHVKAGSQPDEPTSWF